LCFCPFFFPSLTLLRIPKRTSSFFLSTRGPVIFFFSSTPSGPSSFAFVFFQFFDRTPGTGLALSFNTNLLKPNPFFMSATAFSLLPLTQFLSRCPWLSSILVRPPSGFILFFPQSHLKFPRALFFSPPFGLLFQLFFFLLNFPSSKFGSRLACLFIFWPATSRLATPSHVYVICSLFFVHSSTQTSKPPGYFYILQDVLNFS